MATRKNFPSSIKARREGALTRRTTQLAATRREHFSDTLEGELGFQRYLQNCKREIAALETKLPRHVAETA